MQHAVSARPPPSSFPRVLPLTRAAIRTGPGTTPFLVMIGLAAGIQPNSTNARPKYNNEEAQDCQANLLPILRVSAPVEEEPGNAAHTI